MTILDMLKMGKKRFRKEVMNHKINIKSVKILKINIVLFILMVIAAISIPIVSKIKEKAPDPSIKTPNPYYIFEYIITPKEGEYFNIRTKADMITLYNPEQGTLYPSIWLFTDNGYPGIYKIIDQNAMWDFEGIAQTNYRLFSTNARKYALNILRAKYIREIYDYDTHKNYKKIVTAETDPFLSNVMHQAYIDIYNAALTHSTRIQSNEIESVVKVLMSVVE